MLAPRALFGKRCDGPTAHRGKDLDGALAAEVTVRGKEANVLAVDEDVDEAPELAVAQHARRELGIVDGDLPGERRQVRSIEGERRVAPGRCPKWRGESDGDAHDRASAYAPRNSSISADISGPSDGDSSAPL